jgi:hypothetical protein
VASLVSDSRRQREPRDVIDKRCQNEEDNGVGENMTAADVCLRLNKNRTPARAG